ncbi:MAG: hypothetical protein KatS3mg038_2932 [Candidatus Kapaibacterium sp.]|nr:MAG: hypothetical protein KatS3mg038_2932 [Candidatus Kapabacteria bacterium]
MRRVYTTVESRRYGTMCVSFLYDDGQSGVTTVRIPEACIVAQSLVYKHGFDALPLGLEKVPQLEMSLVNNEIVRSEIITPLLDDKRVYVIVDYYVTQIAGPDIYYYKRDRNRTPSETIMFMGILSSKVEVDIAKDTEIKIVADDAVHWWLDNLTASDLYTLITSSAYSADRIGPSAGYEAHPQCGFAFGSIGGNDIRGLRWFDSFFGLRLHHYIGSYVHAAWTRVQQDLGPFVGAYNHAQTPLPPLAAYRMVSQSLQVQSISNVYVYTHYDSSDTDKRYWGALWHVRAARSLRDALKEVLESLCVAACITSDPFANSWGAYRPMLRYVRPLSTNAFNVPATWRVQSHKLFHSVISSVNMTCDAWHGDNNRDREVTRSKRWLDYGVRLGVHNIPMMPSKSYVRRDGSDWVARPDNYNRLAMRRLAFGDTVRVWTLLPLLDDLGRTILDSPTIDGVTYSWTLPASAGMWGINHSMYETLPAHLFAVFGRSAQSRLEYADTSGWVYNFGDKYGIDYVTGQSLNLATCLSTIECIRYAA